MSLMLVGCFLIALGVITPWFVIMFVPAGGGLIADGVTYHRQLVFVNALNLNGASIGHGWITFKLQNSAIMVGVHASEAAGVATAAVWVAQRMRDTELFARTSSLPRLIAAIAMRFIHIGAIITFIAAIWSATHFFDYQDTIRAGAYAAFGGGSAGQTVANDLLVFPFFGLFFLLLGLAASTLALYTADATPGQIARRQRVLARGRRLLGLAGSVLGFAILILVVYGTLEYLGGH